MSEKMIRQVTTEIARALTEREFPFAPTRRAALTFLRVPGWDETLMELFPHPGTAHRQPGTGAVFLCAL